MTGLGQRILGHSSPTITAGVYGHLDVDDMRTGLEQLSFQPRQEPMAEVLPLAVGGPHGAEWGGGGFPLPRAGGKSRGVERG